MTWKHWVIGGLALVVFDVLLIWGVRQWRARSVSPSTPQSVSVIEGANTAYGTPAARPMQTACMDGATWGYDETAQRWLKLRPLLRCEVGDVRDVLERDGAVRRYPRSSGGPHNLTQ